MASLNKTVRDTAVKMSTPTPSIKGAAQRISVEKAKGGYISTTEFKGLHSGPTEYTAPVKAVHKNLSSVKQHMAHAFNVADAEEA